MDNTMTEESKRKRSRMSNVDIFPTGDTDSDEEEPEYNAERRFPPEIINVKDDHLDPKSPGSQQYTVWCSDGYHDDHRPKYHGPDIKLFDSIWATKSEANMRAEYLFCWKNPWGEEVRQMHIRMEEEQSEQDGLKKFTSCDQYGERWTVGVVPSVVYPWLDHASMCRHTNDYNGMR